MGYGELFTMAQHSKNTSKQRTHMLRKAVPFKSTQVALGIVLNRVEYYSAGI